MIDPTLAAIFLPLLCAHLVIDFLAQTRAEVERKGRLHLPTFAVHAGEHALLAYVLCAGWNLWLLPLLVFAAHFAIDLVKETVQRGFLVTHPEASVRVRLSALVIDQTAHVVSLLLIARLLIDMLPEGESPAPTPMTALLVIASGWIIAARVGGVVVGLATQPYLDELNTASADRPASERPSRGLSRGGQAIGTLERTLIFLLMVMGIEAGVGFLIAAKSIFRFGEIKDAQNRMEAEYIIIGTFLSFAWGVGASWLTMLAMGWVG